LEILGAHVVFSKSTKVTPLKTNISRINAWKMNFPFENCAFLGETLILRGGSFCCYCPPYPPKKNRRFQRIKPTFLIRTKKYPRPLKQMEDVESSLQNVFWAPNKNIFVFPQETR